MQYGDTGGNPGADAAAGESVGETWGFEEDAEEHVAGGGERAALRGIV